MSEHRNGPFEVRLNEDGSIDEILLYVNGECVFHLEQMDDSHYWIGFYADGKTMHANVGADAGDAFLNAEWWDDVGVCETMRSFGFPNRLASPPPSGTETGEQQ